MLPKSSGNCTGNISCWKWMQIGWNCKFAPQFDPLKVSWLVKRLCMNVFTRYWRDICTYDLAGGGGRVERGITNGRGGFLADGLIDWSTDWLTDWSHWLTDLTDWLTDRLTDWLTDWSDWLTDWLIWLTDWLTDWPTGWLTDWMTDWSGWLIWLTDWLTDWLANWLTGQLADWLTDGLTDWPTGWLANWLTDWLSWLTDWLLTNRKTERLIWPRPDVTNWLNDLLLDWLIELLTDWPIYWLIDWLIDRLIDLSLFRWRMTVKASWHSIWASSLIAEIFWKRACHNSCPGWGGVSLRLAR